MERFREKSKNLDALIAQRSREIAPLRGNMVVERDRERGERRHGRDRTSGIDDRRKDKSIMSEIQYQEKLIQYKKEFYGCYKNKKSQLSGSIDDFVKMKTLGAGSFGKVMLVRFKPTRAYYAMKILSKETMVKLKQIEHTIHEKQILECITYPFLISMCSSYMDNSYLYFVMSFINGGEMFTHLRNLGKFEENISKFYGVQVCLALEYLHFLDLVYRDLKPENILLDHQGYLKITDFGFCKQVTGRTWTLCGTPEYIAPEIILSKGYSKSVDYWSYGVLLYEMSAGYPPFMAPDPMKLYEKIVSGKFHCPTHFTVDLKDILKNLLQVDLSRRYGNLKSGSQDIKNHRWFREISFTSVYNRKVDSPYKPNVKGEADTSNFDPFDEEPLIISNNDKYADEFKNF